MHSVIQDVRFSLRLMRKRPGMTALVIAGLALGIGLNIAIFSVVNAVLLRPLPIFEPDRVVWLHSKVNQTGAQLGTSYPDYLDWKAQSRSFEGLAAIWTLSFTLTGSGSSEHLKGMGISASGLKTWGVSAALGRDFTEDDDRPGANRAVILNHAFWQRKFSSNPQVLGKSLILDDQTYTIVGVMQPSQLRVLQYADVIVTNGPRINAHIMERDTRYFFPVGRLKANVGLAQAQAEMDTIAARLATHYPDTNKDMGVRLESIVELLTADGRKPLFFLSLASFLIFLLAAVNAMTVFAGNTAERRQELSIRLALGSSRTALLRQLFIQAMIMGTLGAACGLLLAKLGLRFFLRHFPDAAQRFQETTIDWRVILATLILALAATLAATLGPAIYASRIKVSQELRGEFSWFASPKRRNLARGALIFFEVTLACGLSLVAVLLIKSFYEVEKVDLGFNPSQVFSFQINPPSTRYKEPAQQSALYKTAVEKLARLPGMESTSAISSLPLTSQGEVNTLEVDGSSPIFGQELLIEEESILPGWFGTMKVPVLKGRDFTSNDRDGMPPVVIVDDVLAAKLWPGQDPLGKRIHLSTFTAGTARWPEVVGVVQEIKHFGPERKVRWMQAYVPQYQDPTPMLSFVIDTTLPDAAVKSASENALHQLDKELPVDNFESLDDYLDTFLSARKVSLLLLNGLAAIGIVVGTIGVFGVASNAAVRRRREIAIRLALGATIRNTIFLVTRLALVATLAGILAGSVIVISLAHFLRSFLFGISALYPAAYVVTAVILVILAILASIVPAMRLRRLDIQQILRQ